MKDNNSSNQVILLQAGSSANTIMCGLAKESNDNIIQNHVSRTFIDCEMFVIIGSNASQRISTLFLELLERQFPIDENHQTLNLRSASDFAQQLNVHVNHLNRAVKETSEKTTSQIIAERILQESKILLKHSAWNVSEIAFALGFREVSHFNNFFKKYVQLSPLKFRNI